MLLWMLLLLLLALWVGGGSLLLHLHSRPAGRDYRRKVDRRVVRVGADVEVSLRLIPPVAIGRVEDRDVVLALDHSGSMGSGPASPLREALRAAESFVDRCPEQIHVGLVIFDHQAELASPIQGERGALRRALHAVGSGGGTAIHDALDHCTEALSGGRDDVPKTVILLSDGFSDRRAAAAAAERLRETGTTVIGVGFGPGVDEELMITVTGDAERYCHVDQSEDLETVFAFLASAISGQMAVAGRVDEQAKAPSPFELGGTGELYPLGVDVGETTGIVWSVPLLDLKPVALSYRLVPECPGWHAVATDESKATWRMPDGSERETPGPAGPRVLALPELWSWAWPVLNPFFWMLFSRFFCQRPAVEEEPVDLPALLPTPSFPEPLPEPRERPYEARVRPALVIGLGALGEWVLCRLKDRGLDEGTLAGTTAIGGVEVVNLEVSHPSGRPPVELGSVRLEGTERVTLCQDLRPYVESLRNGAPSSRAWIPWRRWLAESRPLTTLHGVAGDRRKARLALLQMPEELETRLAASVARVVAEDGLVIVAGAADDPEGSGLVAEVAHMCACHGAGVTAVLTRATEAEIKPLIALERELSRLISLRGDAVISDRKHSPEAASKLFDRLVLVPGTESEAMAASEPASELIWGLLAYGGLEPRLPTARRRDDEVLSTAVTLDAFPLPAHNLWRWVRELTLAGSINGSWLGLEVVDGEWELAIPPPKAVDEAVASFYSPSGFKRPQNRLVANARLILDGQNPVAALLGRIPSDALHHEQVRFHRHERRAFLAFLEEWCQHVLAIEQKAGRWGLPLLMASLRRLESDYQSLLERIEGMSSTEGFQSLTRLASELYLDEAMVLERLAREGAAWIAVIVGDWIDLGVVGDENVEEPLCTGIEKRRQAAEAALHLPSETMREEVLRRADEWSKTYGPGLLRQLLFRVTLADERLGLGLWLGERRLGLGGDLGLALREELDRYRGLVLGWPLLESIPEAQVSEPSLRCRLGKHSARVWPQVSAAIDEEDPHLLALLKIREVRLSDALGVTGERAPGVPFVWPEEANAKRLGEKIRNALLREPRPFSPLVVHLLRDTRQLNGFLADLARGRVVEQEGEYRLNRDGGWFRIGPAGEKGLEPEQALDRFEAIVRQVVVFRISLDREKLPEPGEPWNAEPEAAVAEVEAHPLTGAAKASPRWSMWQDVIRGLALEAEDFL